MHLLCGCIAMETGTKPHSHIVPGYGRIEVARRHLPCAALGSFASFPKRDVARKGMDGGLQEKGRENKSHRERKWPIKCEKINRFAPLPNITVLL